MDSIRQYLLTVLAAALVCGITVSLVGKKGSLAGIIKLLCGIFMAVAVLRPLADLRPELFTDFSPEFHIQAEQSALEGENSAREAISEIITGQTQAYILDKAKTMGASLSVEVVLDEGMPPVPCGVYLRGSISPYNKKRLSELIENDLGISLEAQIWTG